MRVGRTARRWHDHAVDVLNIQSLNSYHAATTGLTTVSIAVNLGVWLPHASVEGRGVRRDKQDRPLPAEYDCAFRTRVRNASGGDWYLIAEHGGDVEERVAEASADTQRQALVWFDERHQLQEQLRLLDHKHNGDIGMGAPRSPVHLFLLGMTAHAAGDAAAARGYLQDYLVAAERIPFGAADAEVTAVERVLAELP